MAKYHIYCETEEKRVDGDGTPALVCPNDAGHDVAEDSLCIYRTASHLQHDVAYGSGKGGCYQSPDGNNHRLKVDDNGVVSSETP